DGERGHDAHRERALLAQVRQEHLAQRTVVVEAGGDVPLVAAHPELVRDAPPRLWQARSHGPIRPSPLVLQRIHDLTVRHPLGRFSVVEAVPLRTEARALAVTIHLARSAIGTADLL